MSSSIDAYNAAVDADVDLMLRRGCKFRVSQLKVTNNDFYPRYSVIITPDDAYGLLTLPPDVDTVTIGKFWRKKHAKLFAAALNNQSQEDTCPEKPVEHPEDYFTESVEYILENSDLLVKEDCKIMDGKLYESLHPRYPEYRVFFHCEDYDYIENEETIRKLNKLFGKTISI